MNSDIIDNVELREQIRTFLIRTVGVDYSAIDKIDIYRMKDGQIRDIRISFIPQINQQK